MKKNLSALVAGVLFGLGLAVSQMINPRKIIAFLDVAGDWDPSLALVLLAAVVVTWAGFALGNRRAAPLFAGAFQRPTRKDIDTRLLTGAAIFGIGWGLAGYCPGPAIAALAVGSPEPFIFVAALAAGSFVQGKIGA